MLVIRTPPFSNEVALLVPCQAVRSKCGKGINLLPGFSLCLLCLNAVLA